MPDNLWLTDEGELHPAALKMGLPEWEDRRDKFRLWYEVPPKSAWRTWRVQVWERFTSQSENEWLPCRDCTAHEAAALLEKAAREWLAERRIHLSRWENGEWSVNRWVPCKGGYTQQFLWSTPDGYRWGADEKAVCDIADFPTYTAALQAGILAAKGEE